MPDIHSPASQLSRILHLSCDYPDPINPAKTPVIAHLLDLVSNDFEHQVLSLNRRRPTFGETARLAANTLRPVVEHSLQPIARGACLAYLAPSQGLLHNTMLQRLAGWIAESLTHQQALPNLVVGHKLTIEGILARAVAEELGVPFAVTIQGNTDAKILRFRPDLRRQFARIYHEAACVFSFSPWARSAVERRLGHRTGLVVDLPCPTELDTVRAPTACGASLISVFHLRNQRIKNLEGLTQAMRALEAGGCSTNLQIIGGGSETETAACAGIIGNAGNIVLNGPRTLDQLPRILNEGIALVMPSRRESFGLVFIEALFAGLPIIYPRGASVDGYFDGLPFAIPVEAQSPRAIADAIRHVVVHEGPIKEALARWQVNGGLERFSRNAIGKTFRLGLQAALGLRAVHRTAA